MSVDLILAPQNDALRKDSVDLALEPQGVLRKVASAETKSPDTRLGIFGLAVAGAIIAASVYSILKYLW